MDQLLQALQATTVLLSNEPHCSVDTIFFHARAWDDDDDLFSIAAHIYHSYTHKSDSVTINGGKGGPPGNTAEGENWPGYDAYLKQLEELHVDSVYATAPALNTKAENEAFLALAIVHQWKSAIILSQPHQILRSFLGMIASMRDHNYWMRIYAVAPKHTNWFKLVYGSPCAGLKPRFRHIEEELRRIPIYQANGDLASYDELFTYL